MVGSRRLELPTSSVSRKRSNQLSYEPMKSTSYTDTNEILSRFFAPDEQAKAAAKCHF
jgi:hypothetical protein